MTIIDITEENIEEYRDIIPGEYLMDIGREYCRGLIGVPPESHTLSGAIFWEVRNVEHENVANVADIHWFFVNTEEESRLILDAFEIRSGYDEAKNAFFELEDLKDHEVTAFTNMGFTISRAEGMDVYVTAEEVAALDLGKKAPPAYVRSISGLSSFQFKAGIMNSVFHERYGILDDLPFLPMSWYNPDLSSCVITDDKVSGILLVHDVRPDLHRIELLFSEKLDAARDVRDMIRFSIRAVAEHCAPEEQILIRRHSPNVKALAQKLFPNSKGAAVMRGIKK